MAQAQGDLIGLHAVSGEGVVSVTPGVQRQPFERVVRALELLEPAGRWPLDGRALAAALTAGARAPGGSGTREIVVVLTDGHEQGEEIRAALAPLRARRHELVLLHLVGRDEIDFPFHGPVRFEDLETGATLETDGDAARAGWIEGRERHIREWRPRVGGRRPVRVRVFPARRSAGACPPILPFPATTPMTLLAPAALWTLAALALPLTDPSVAAAASHRAAGQPALSPEQPGPLAQPALARAGVAAGPAGVAGDAGPGPGASFLEEAAPDASGAVGVCSTRPRRRRERRSNGGAPCKPPGVETRLLAPGFPPVSVPPGDGSAPAPDLWSLLREADAALPAGSSLAVFSPGRLAALRGVRPALGRSRVEWIDTPLAPPPPSGAIRDPTTLTRPLTILILHDPDRAGDARYAAAAWRAVAQTDKRPLNVSVAPTTAAHAAADWIFWLGAPPVAAQAADVLEDAPSPTADAPPGWLLPQPGAAFGGPVRLWQRGSPADGAVIWTDGFGQPLLTRSQGVHGARWHFASRFDPAWNDLPLGSALPAALRTLLPAPEPAGTHDGRLADPSQCLPSDATAAGTVAVELRGTEIDARPWLWLLAAVLFCVERLLSHRGARRPLAAAVPAAPQPVALR